MKHFISLHQTTKDNHLFFDFSKLTLNTEHERSFSCCADVLQVESLTERVEELKQDKKRLVEEYEAKLSKVQYCSHCRGHTHTHCKQPG